MDFENRLQSWLAGAQRMIDVRYAENYPSLEVPKLELERGRRYIRVVRRDRSQRSAHAFIDIANGDVLKPASWKTPAKHARGNIFDDANGLRYMTDLGPAYLR